MLQEAEALDGSGAAFQHDRWTRSPGNPNAGYGITSGGWGLAQSSAGGTTHTFLFGGACLALTRPSPCHAARGAVLEGGQVLEKGAANISVVAGTLSPERAQAMSRRGQATIDPAGGQSYAGAACRG